MLTVFEISEWMKKKHGVENTLGINVVRKTVDVTLYDQRGKLPANRPPQAISQDLTAVPGLPRSISLSGTDPDGDDLAVFDTSHARFGAQVVEIRSLEES